MDFHDGPKGYWCVTESNTERFGDDKSTMRRVVGRGRLAGTTMVHEEAEGLSMTLAKLLQRSDRLREMRQAAPIRSPSPPPYEPSPGRGANQTSQVALIRRRSVPSVQVAAPMEEC